MISLIILFLSFVVSLSPSQYQKESANSTYSRILAALAFSYAYQGFLCLIVAFLGNSNFPILVLSILTACFVCLLKKGEFFANILYLKSFLFNEIESAINTSKGSTRVLIIVILACVGLVYFSSIGPINHPDASDYHVGYPYQILKNRSLFVDGGLHEGLLGLGDYANLAFLQEKTTWLIRTTQIIGLLPITFFLISNKANKLLLLAFIASPVFIQWASIGKPMFLTESALAIAYLAWKANQTSELLRLLLLTSISCVLIKISSLIILLPIFSDVIFQINLKEINSRKNQIILNIFKSHSFNLHLFASICMITLLALVRFDITNNFFYPLFSRFFTPDDPLAIHFEDSIRAYGRSHPLFPITIFIPFTINQISSVLGPALGTAFLFSFLNNIFYSRSSLINMITPFSQLSLLFFFGQGRADYYAVPSIIFIYYTASELTPIFKKSSQLLFKIFIPLLFIQVATYLGLLAQTISTNIQSLLNYQKAMSLYAYGYHGSSRLNHEIGDSKFSDLSTRNTRLYYRSKYVDRDRFWYCAFDQIPRTNPHSFYVCSKKLGIQTLLINNTPTYQWINESPYFRCEEKENIIAARNPLSPHSSKRRILSCHLSKDTD